MAYTPQDVRPMGANAGTDVQLKVGASGDLHVIAQGSSDGGTTLHSLKTRTTGELLTVLYGSDDAGTTLRLIKTNASGELVVAATDLDIRALTAADDAVAVYGSDDAGATKRIVKTDASGRVVVTGDAAAPLPVTIADETPGTDFFEHAEDAAIAAGATDQVYEEVVANGTTLTLERVEVQGDGAIEWQLIEYDGVSVETIKAKRYTSAGAPSAVFDLGGRYKLVGDAAKSIRIKAKNIDAIQSAVGSCNVIGYTST